MQFALKPSGPSSYGVHAPIIFNNECITLSGRLKMLNLQRNMAIVNSEYRVNPRIEFHYPVLIIGFDAKATIIDFSMGGFYIRTESPVQFMKDQRIKLFLRLPEEKAGVTVKAEVIHHDENGFGCKLLAIQPEVNRVLSKYFNMFAGMLPIE